VCDARSSNVVVWALNWSGTRAPPARSLNGLDSAAKYELTLGSESIALDGLLLLFFFFLATFVFFLSFLTGGLYTTIWVAFPFAILSGLLKSQRVMCDVFVSF